MVNKSTALVEVSPAELKHYWRVVISHVPGTRETNYYKTRAAAIEGLLNTMQELSQEYAYVFQYDGIEWMGKRATRLFNRESISIYILEPNTPDNT